MLAFALFEFDESLKSTCEPRATVTHTLNNEQNSSYLQLRRRLIGKMLIVYSKNTSTVQEKKCQ